MSSVLTVGLVGCGPRSLEHMKAIDATPGLRMAAGADVTDAGRDRYLARYQTPFYRDAAQMFAESKLDIVVLCTREEPRYALASAALRAGVPGLVLEKPLARTLDQARQLADQVAAAKATAVVCHQMRFCDEFVAAREAIRRGEIGQVHHIRASCYGQLMEQGPHMVDMALWLTEPARVQWAMGAVGDIEAGFKTVHIAPAFTVGYLALDSGVRVTLECGRSFARHVEFPNDTWMVKRIEAQGTRGTIDAVVSHYCRLMNDTAAGWQTRFSGSQGWDQATIKFYGELQQVMTRGGVHRNDISAALPGFEAIQAIYQAALVRERVSLPLPPGVEPLNELMPASAKAGVP